MHRSPIPAGRRRAPRTAVLLLLLGAGAAACSGGPQRDDDTVIYTDFTALSGIDFRSVGGRKSNFVLDLMGSGAVLFDYDGDGDLDFYGITGSALEGFGDDPPPTNALFENRGDGTFRRAAPGSGLEVAGWGMGAAAADYDDDGDLDLYLTRFGANVLFRNEGGGRFVDVTAEAGVGDGRWGAGACFLDYDADGDLDLYVVNYLEFDLPEGEVGSLAATLGLRFPALPHEYPGQDNVLYRNEGDGRFVDVTAESGAADPGGKGLGAISFDYDDDGDLDIYVCNDTTRNSLLENQGDGTFVDVALAAGVAYDGMGAPQGSMGVAAGDLNGDGVLDLVVTNFAHEGTTIYLNQGEGTFTDDSSHLGVIPQTLGNVGWGVDLFDYDHDGDVDLFLANGHLLGDVTMSVIRAITPEGYLPGTMTPKAFRGGYAQRNRLFENAGAGRLEDVTDAAGDAFDVKDVSRGAAFGDIDGDGDIDIVVVNKNSPARVLRNEGGARRPWLKVAPRGTGCNHFGVGARIEVRAGGRRQVRVVKAGSSYIGQDALEAHFGLGGEEAVEEIRVRWPCGRVQRVGGGPARRRVEVVEPAHERNERPGPKGS